MSADSAPMSAAPALFPREPRRVGKFDFLMRLGQGGMATVYLARSVSTGGFQRLVAIKLMHQFLGADGQFVEMFLDEARVAANVRHPNVVSIVDLGTDGEHLFMVMDYVEGDTLAAVEGTAARLGRAIPLGVVLRIVLDALAGLDAAHELKTPDNVDLKVVHRDVSPQNILVGVDGAARLTDFGIARAEQRIATTRTGMLKGKAPFMAPEQFEGKPVDRRADVFAMGVTLWEAVALRRLFPGRESYEQAVRNARAPYRKLKDILPSVPESLDAIVRKALAHNPSERFPTAAAFADALEGEFRHIIASHRQVGAFMAAVASEKIQRERDAVRTAPKPTEDPAATRPGTRTPRATAYGLRRPEEPISPSAVRAFDSRPPEKIPSLPPANDTRKVDDDDPEVAAALLALQELPEESPAELPALKPSSFEAREPASPARLDEDLPAPARSVTPVRANGVPARRARASTMNAPVIASGRKSTPPRLRSTVTAGEVAFARSVTPRPRGAIPTSPVKRDDEAESQPPRRRRAPSLAGPRPMFMPPMAPAEPAEPPSLALARATPEPPAPGRRPSNRALTVEDADAAIEFDVTSSKRREGADAAKPTEARAAAIAGVTARGLERVRTDARKVAPEATAAVSDDALTVPAAPRRPTAVARFPSLVPSPKSSLLNNRWISGAVLAAVLFVVFFVIARGL
jgi:serine/threonine protein kinase